MIRFRGRPGPPQGSGGMNLTMIVPAAGAGGNGAGSGGSGCGDMEIFVGASGWLTTDLDASDGYVVLAIYNLPAEADVLWDVTIDDHAGGTVYDIPGCLTDRALVIHAPKNQPADITASATVNGMTIGPFSLTVDTNQQVCA